MQPSDQPDIQHLIARARQGDEAALRWLYETHRTRIHRLAVTLLGDGDEADDVVQDVMIYALRNLDRYQSERAAFGTWLHTVTVSRCRDRGRRARRGAAGLRAWWSSNGEEAVDPEDNVARIDAHGALGPALASLTPLQREALALRAVSELSFQEIGDALGIPLRTAQTRVTGAIAALRRALSAHSAPPTAAAPTPSHVAPPPTRPPEPSASRGRSSRMPGPVRPEDAR
ncbi:MAG: RNA polymerase sigma factor [Ardenticatenales bacterium]|nr:RNA polymerase sigma factor [Ardenticatenales bacterium]